MYGHRSSHWAGIEDYEVKSPESETDISEVRPVTSVITHEDPSPRRA
jgi:hypothetical protein